MRTTVTLEVDVEEMLQEELDAMRAFTRFSIEASIGSVATWDG